MRKVILFGLLLYVGVATAFGQKSAVQVFGVPFGSTYEEFLTAFSEKGFTGKTYIYEGGSDVEVSSIYGTFMTYECYIEMRATKLTHTVYKIKISFSVTDKYKDIPGMEQCRAIISRFEEKYGKATLIQKIHGGKVVQNLEESSAAIWHLDEQIDLELFYRGFDDCKVTYGGKEALDGIFQKEVDQFNKQKALEIQNQLSGSDF